MEYVARAIIPREDMLRLGMVFIPYKSTDQGPGDSEARFKALRAFCDRHGIELEDDEVEFLPFHVADSGKLSSRTEECEVRKS